MIAFILIFAAMIAAGYLGAKGVKKFQAWERRKLIEQNMRQQIIDAESERVIAAKLLRQSQRKK